MVWNKCIIILLISTFFISASANCEFNLNQNITNEPLLLWTRSNGDDELVKLTECKIRLNTTQELLLACPGKGNHLNLTMNSENVGKCQSRNNFQINQKPVQFSNLACKTRPKATLKISGKQCFKNAGVIIYIGFEVKNSWYPLLEVCHNITKSHSYYVKHTIIIPTSPCTNTPNTRPGFNEGGVNLYSDINMDNMYSTKYQYTLLTKLVGTNASYYINRNETKFLARGHLAPDADFQLDAWKSLTYFYLNTAPQWQSINSASWESLEQKIRKLAAKLKQLEVITGTFGIMKIERKNLYLGNVKLPVPEHFWKLIHNSKDDSCMGFISKNNPFLKRQAQHICQDICSRYGWQIGNRNLFHGYVHCCEYHQLSKAIGEVPNVRCRKALHFT